MTKLNMAAVVAFLLATGSASAATVLDFDTMNGGGATAPGNIDGTEFTDFGVSISRTGTTNPIALFNSNCLGATCTGGDTDLASGASFGTALQGRVLIVNEGSSAAPDDFAGNYTFNFAFSDLGGVDFGSVSILDLDGQEQVEFTAFFADLTSAVVLADAITLLGTKSGDNSLRLFEFSLEGVTRFDVEFKSNSGAIGSLTYDRPAPVPVPAALPLLAAGLGFLAWAGRRRRAA